MFADVLHSYVPGIWKDRLRDMVELVPENITGDLAFPCFILAKELKQNPHTIAKDLAQKLWESYVAVWWYLNWILDIQTLAHDILLQIRSQGDRFGAWAEKSDSYMIEWWALNTHKSVHIGHVRNILLSDSIANLLDFAGYKVIKVAYRWDIGAHVAKWLWYYINYAKTPIPHEYVSKWAWSLYVDATNKVDENPDQYKEEIHILQKRLEDQDPELLQIRKDTREACLVDLKNVLSELWTHNIVRYYTESEVEHPWILKAKELEKIGVAQYSDGAIIVDLEEYGLWVSVILKKNGTSLYITKDLALADLKKKEFVCDHYLYVVWSEQKHHFQQLFKVLELAKFPVDDMHHVSYAMVELASGKMSSRKWNVILYEDLRDRLLEYADKLLEQRNVSNKKESARKIVFAALKFSMLLPDTQKKIIFDPDTVMSFEWETGPYIQYAFVRIQSILQSVEGVDETLVDYSLLNTEEDRSLIMKLVEFEDLLQKAALTYQPNLIARWSLDLAKLFNNYYHKHKIMWEDSILQNTRLLLIQCVGIALENALRLLGIETLNEM